jgi:hypothetical protein
MYINVSPDLPVSGFGSSTNIYINYSPSPVAYIKAMGSFSFTDLSTNGNYINPTNIVYSTSPHLYLKIYQLSMQVNLDFLLYVLVFIILILQEL